VLEDLVDLVLHLKEAGLIAIEVNLLLAEFVHPTLLSELEGFIIFDELVPSYEDTAMLTLLRFSEQYL